MIKFIKIILKGLAIFILSIALIYLFFSIKWRLEASRDYALFGPEAPKLKINNKVYRDLNKNGKLDTYENPEAQIEDRVEDLISQMNSYEKAGAIFIDMIGVNADGTPMEFPSFSDPFSFLMETSSVQIAKKKMNHFNIRASHPKEKMIEWQNAIQKMGERSRLGIPITIASDPRHGVPTQLGASIHTPYFSSWPSALGMGAINDSLLVQDFGAIVREEYKALGIRVALGPMADTSTEPRWFRIDGTFGENSDVNSRLVSAYIRGLQGDSLGVGSVAAMVKHFPGGGTPENGKDTHFPPGIQIFEEANFEEHLKPFIAAFEAKTASVMPFYSIAKGITTEEVGASYNKEIITGMLRERLGFEGIICTDWAMISDKKAMGILFKPASAHGVEHLNTDERIIKIIDAGVDMIGGESLSEELVELILKGKIEEKRIDQSLKRIMRQKFQLGLFDNPYLTKENLKILDNKISIEKGKEAQRKALVLLKNNYEILPLKPQTKIYLHGFDTKKVKNAEVTSLEKADVIVAKVDTPQWGGEKAGSVMELLISGERLDFPEEELDILIPLLKTKPTILVANLKRPTVLSQLEPFSKAIVADFDVSEDIIFELILGGFNPSGNLPIQLPSSMKSVLNQKEDLAFDLEKPLYDYGHGLRLKNLD